MTKSTRIAFALSAIAVVAVVGTLSSATTNALWNGSAPIAPITVTTGTAALAVGLSGADPTPNALTLPSGFVTGFLPGDRHDQGITLSNTGSVPLEVSATGSGVPGPMTLQLSTGSCTAEPAPTAPTLSDAPTRILSIAPGNTEVCLSLALSADAPTGLQGTQLSAALTVNLIGVTSPDDH